MDDLISRQAEIDAIEPTLKSILQGNSFKAINVMDKIRNLPSAEPECNLDECCHDCKEYDKEKNRCPRFNRVIRTALSEWRGEKDALN